jgi:hypothetical protein
MFFKRRRDSGAGQMRGEVDFSELYGKRIDPEEVKEIKVMIPSNQHVKLHGYKVLTGKTISSMVNEALDMYFARKTAEKETIVAEA